MKLNEAEWCPETESTFFYPPEIALVFGRAPFGVPINDKNQIGPMLDRLAKLPDALGAPDTLLADTGYFSAANVEACVSANIQPMIAVAREHHHPSWQERFATARQRPPDAGVTRLPLG